MINPAATVQPSKSREHHDVSSSLAWCTANRAPPIQTISIRISPKSTRMLIPATKQNLSTWPTQRTDWNQDRKFNTKLFLFFVFVLDVTTKDADTTRLDSCRIWTEPCGDTTNTPFRVFLKDICMGGQNLGWPELEISQQAWYPIRWTGGTLFLRLHQAFSWVPGVFQKKEILISHCDESQTKSH